jgi:hypothetical protein
MLISCTWDKKIKIFQKHEWIAKINIALFYKFVIFEEERMEKKKMLSSK